MCQKNQVSTGGIGLGWVCSVAISSDGNFLAGVIENKGIKVWCFSTGEEVCFFQFQYFYGGSIAFTAKSDSIIFTSGDEGAVLIAAAWDLTTKKLIWSKEQGMNEVYAMALSPDGSIFATSDLYQTISFWDVYTGDKVFQLTDNSNFADGLAFSPDGMWLCCGGCDSEADNEYGEPLGSIDLWDMATKQKVCSLTGHSSSVRCLAFSPDCQTLVSGDLSGIIRVWRRVFV